ncbi:sphingolipid delta(4)-desaturase DES1 isoform X2 [Procambarus clarkii]|uniref:sphingolipid delta(4)-desaturase DES1 isoform X2 n=1 Tax=Procambarus clarkii TaxID=6728 RepID=UPI001E674E9B|nr:sphingolipid delta(4)-desaturase DES1-like isoform X3 [Procambarus clarkii]
MEEDIYCCVLDQRVREKHPEIKELFGNDPNLIWWVLGLVTFQILSLFVVRELSWLWVLILCYCIGGTINHSLMLAIHEISHNLAFGHSRPLSNRILGMFANFPIILPFSVSFKGYHLEHHKFQGDEKLDTDIPTYTEARLFCTTFGKMIWMFLQPLFYAFRPLLTYPKTPTLLEIINTCVQLSFNFFVFYYFGGKSLVYLGIGSLLAMGLHPVAGHFISEHYMFEKGFETYSYYGPLNRLTFNVGYHNEHHDFPYVPGSRLPKVKEIAAEFYDDLPQHSSWVKVIYDFITDPAIGPYARIKRKHAGFAKDD